MSILNSYVVYKFQTVNTGCPPPLSHSFWSTAIQQDIRAVFAVVNCVDVALSVFYFPVLMRCQIEQFITAKLSKETAVNVHYSDTLWPASTSKQSACRIICIGMPENGGMAGPLPPLPFQKGGSGGEVVFSYQYHREFHGLSRSTWNKFIQIFGHPENLEWFSIISVIIFEVNNVDEQKQT